MALMSFTEQQGKTLLDVAKASIKHGLAQRSPLTVNPLDYPSQLGEVRASFVTLKIHHNLRGCMGTIVAFRPLVSDVAYHAHAAAFSDPRFSPLQPSEFPDLDIHISVLSVPEPIYFNSEEDLIRQLRPGQDGLIIQEGIHRGTFLPSVWESLPEPREFLLHLKQKAGLPPTYWSNTLTVQRYTTESIF
jgi:AmmeMemoRadiSam system protein A